MILQGTLSPSRSLSLSLSFSLSSPNMNIGHIAEIQIANVKIYNIHRLAVPADRQNV